ncbi:MAG: hypothetical protein FWC65_00785 [Treponema sp.]|nr:hypothetical protein [Treponema sp.]
MVVLYPLFGAALCAALSLLSCASSPAAYARIDSQVQAGSHEAAVASINSRRGARRTVYSSRNDILFYLDRGMVKHFAGMYMESFQDLHNAERLMEEAFTRSLTQDIGVLLLNDSVREYRGENYENLYINVFNALNFYFLGDIERALVEVRRLNEKLDLLADRYERLKRRVVDSSQHIDPSQLPMEASRFSNSALARYLGMLFYRGTSRHDSARIDYEELLRAFSLAPEVYAHPIPASVHDELVIPEGKARLNVIAFTGLAPIKEESHILIPLPFAFPNNSARISLPVMVNRPQTITRAEVVLDSGERFRLELLEDIGAVARETFRATHSLTILRSTARAITRAGAAAVGAHAAERSGGEGIGMLVGLAGRIFSEAAEQADTRISRFFPAHALVGAVNLLPGSYTVTINFYGHSGHLSSQSTRMEVRENILNLTRFVCLR